MLDIGNVVGFVTVEEEMTSALEAGGRRQEAGGRRQETRRQEAEGRRQGGF
ncbi:MAG: hypothetical protein F6K47_17865 [Symploca sp. SIO2E6]|nr:hypothetical protein [Symploca sp. SIO2E6]